MTLNTTTVSIAIKQYLAIHFISLLLRSDYCYLKRIALRMFDAESASVKNMKNEYT